VGLTGCIRDEGGMAGKTRSTHHGDSPSALKSHEVVLLLLQVALVVCATLRRGVKTSKVISASMARTRCHPRSQQVQILKQVANDVRERGCTREPVEANVMFSSVG
jgi:hypothetical protein